MRRPAKTKRSGWSANGSNVAVPEKPRVQPFLGIWRGAEATSETRESGVLGWPTGGAPQGVLVRDEVSEWRL